MFADKMLHLLNVRWSSSRTPKEILQPEASDKRLETKIKACIERALVIFPPRVPYTTGRRTDKGVNNAYTTIEERRMKICKLKKSNAYSY